MKLHSRASKTSNPVVDGDEDQRNDERDNVSGDDDEVYEVLSSETDDDDEVYEVLSSATDDDSDSSDGDDDCNPKTNSRKRKERPKNDIDVEMNDDIDDIPGPSKNTGKNNGRKEKIKMPVSAWKIWEAVHDKWLDENEDRDFDLEKQDEVMMESAEAPSDMNVELLRYQKEWLAWALNQESSSVRGGILADEMGMGKTVQAIALVLAKRELSREACGSSSRSSSFGSTRLKGTLVICPVVAVTQWVSEIERFAKKGSTKILVYHGSNRERYLKQFSEYDFVITTYSIVRSEYRKSTMPPAEKCPICRKQLDEAKMKNHMVYFCGKDFVKIRSKPPKVFKCKNLPPKGKSPLFAAEWERIILDEAQHISNRYNITTESILDLDSTYKWCLSGTLVENSGSEFYSYIRFLQIVPYSFCFCQTCDCMILYHRASWQCSNCTHKRHISWWNKYVALPMRSDDEDKIRRATIMLNHKVLKMSVLRRTKKGRAADLALPPKIIILRRDDMDIEESDYYLALHTKSRAKFDAYVEAGTLTQNFGHIFQLLTCLRLAVLHPYLVEYSASAASKDEKNAGNQTGKTKISGYKSSSILNRLELSTFRTSTKIEALREEIRFMFERDGSAKGIVFSQFISFLDLISYSLQKSGVTCIRLDGSMTMRQRDAAVKTFTEDRDCRIFLMSMKAGGVALNLTVASHVFLMDPWWNPSVERQAQDRIHRNGQHKPIRIVRFIMENTVEEKILSLQKKKELLFEGTLGGSSEALGKLKSEELSSFFY